MKTKIFLLAAILSTGMVCKTQAQWSLTGNAGTSPGTNFIGTSDGEALVIKTDNVERLRVTDGGNVGIGTTTPSTKLHIAGSVRIVDGTEGAGKVFKSDANGVGSWAAASGIAIGDAIGSATAGRVLFTGTGGALQQSADLLFDSTSTNFVVGPNQVISDYFGFAQGQGNFVTNRGAAALNGYGIAGGWYSLSTGLSNRVDGTAGYVGGKGNFSRSYAETVIGSFATDYTAASVSVHDVADRVFTVGIGTAEDARADALVIKKSGRVGIGTSSPQAVLHVKGGESWFSAEERNILIYNTDNSQFIGGMGRNTANAALSVASVLSDLELTAGGSAGHIRLYTLNSNKDITLQPTRSVGINTTSPNSDAKLDVNGNVFASGKVAIANTAPGDYHLKVNGKSSLVGTVDVGSAFGDNTVALSVGSDAAYLLGMYTAGGSPRMKVDQNGSIDITGGIGNLSAAGTGYFMTRLGVGTSTPNTNAKLDVNGNIFTSGKIAIGTTDMTKISDYSLVVNGEALFTKARVKLYSNWPDYVFEDKYGLLPIAQLEQYIKTNKHLPGIPSAAEVAKEGIDLGGNQAQLLQKIEELTLYIIDQNKKMETLQKKVEKLEKNNP